MNFQKISQLFFLHLFTNESFVAEVSDASSAGVQGCVDALVCEVWDVFGIEVGKSGGVRKQENEKSGGTKKRK